METIFRTYSAGDDVAGNPDDADDAELVRAVAAGDRAALATLYRRHSQVLLAQLMLEVGEQTLSEELLQDTMLAVWRGAASFRGDAKVRTWLIAIARRQARDRLRRHRLRSVDDTLLTESPAAEPGPEQHALGRAEAAAVASAIRALSRPHRELIGLVFGAGLTMAEAAQVLEIPLGTVKSRLSAARAALTQALTEKGYVR
jgi:RNA polymerase sigma-70 factor (ECF subfamily)